MIDQRSLRLRPTLVGAPQRPSYETGSYLAAHGLLTEQRHRLQQLHHHDRYLHGWGVVCGLLVVPAQEPGRPWAVQVCPGYAIGCCGEEIEVRSPTTVDIRDYLWTRPSEHGRPAPLAYVSVRYAEELARPVPVNPPACGCDETVYKPSRIKDGFEVDVLWAPPKVADRPPFDICERQMAPCPDCGDSRHVFLACVTLPASESDRITSADIDNRSHRQQIATTAVLQYQLVGCCCDKAQHSKGSL